MHFLNTTAVITEYNQLLILISYTIPRITDWLELFSAWHIC